MRAVGFREDRLKTVILKVDVQRAQFCVPKDDVSLIYIGFTKIMIQSLKSLLFPTAAKSRHTTRLQYFFFTSRNLAI